MEVKSEQTCSIRIVGPTRRHRIVSRTIRLFVEEKQEQIQLFPCDMYRLDDFALDIILGQPAGVPVDAQKNEQFTLAEYQYSANYQNQKLASTLFQFPS